MRFRSLLLPSLLSLAAPPADGQNPPGPITMEQIMGYPFTSGMSAAATGSRIAWVTNQRGRRNVFVAEGPDFHPRAVTEYRADDGQEITSLQISRDGKWVVFVRGGDFGSNFDLTDPVNTSALPIPPNVEIYTIPFAHVANAGGGRFRDGARPLGEGQDPVISPRSDRIAFVRGSEIWVADIDGTSVRRIIAVRGDNASPVWSPDGSRLAFVSNRGDHSFIGIYTSEERPIVWIDPTTSRDASPRWSPDGSRVAFIRRPGTGGAPDSILADRHVPWAIWTADAVTGEARTLWSSPTTLRGSLPTTHGGTNLHWGPAARIVFLSYMDGWPHLYSIPPSGGEPLLLSPGNFMAEHISLSPDGRYLFFSANYGSAVEDVDRRHVVRVPVDRAIPEILTPGTGIEWSPVVTGDGGHVAFVGATPQRPPLPAVMSLSTMSVKWLAEFTLESFPTQQLVTPRRVFFAAPDGLLISAQLFDNGAAGRRRPAVIYVHGGPPRQMLLGWHYSQYYANAYALNQYLASRGFIVLSVNYRLGIGYGREFQHPKNAGPRGASEYQDIKAAALWLRTQDQVDSTRIGVYGGSYGGYLTGLALARNSDLFAAGVNIHGVHDWSGDRARPMLTRDRYELAPDLARALETAWRSSPISQIATWKSPVLLIHGDDDRNVRFSQTVDLVQRLSKAGVPFEEVTIPDDTHHFMRYANQLRVNNLTAAFLVKKLLGGT